MPSKEYQQAWHQANKERRLPAIKARKKEYLLRNRDLVRDYLQTHPCVDCGESDVRVLEFDHRPGEIKVAGISALVNKPCSLKALEQEIEKCDVRCANHHRIITCERAGDWHKSIMVP